MKKLVEQKRLQLEEELRILEQELAKILASTQEVEAVRKSELHRNISSLYSQIEGLKAFEKISEGLPSAEEILDHVDRIATGALEKGGRFLKGLGSKLSDAARGTSREGSEDSEVDYDFKKIIDLIKEGKKQFAYADLMSLVGEKFSLDSEGFERMRHAIDAAENLIKAGREDVALDALQKIFG